VETVAASSPKRWYSTTPLHSVTTQTATTSETNNTSDERIREFTALKIQVVVFLVVTLKKEAAWPSETLVSYYITARWHNQEHHYLNNLSDTTIRLPVCAVHAHTSKYLNIHLSYQEGTILPLCLSCYISMH
jgi:hypothetical protein